LFHVVLFQPEIPPNTGNIIRLCSNTGAQLHLIKPLAFELDDKRLRRAGLDYREWVTVKVHDSLEVFRQQAGNPREFACSTKASTLYHQVSFRPGDALVFGPETRGLPHEYLTSLANEQVIRVPMKTNSRSLNLSNATAIILFEALRQCDFQEM